MIPILWLFFYIKQSIPHIMISFFSTLYYLKNTFFINIYKNPVKTEAYYSYP